VLKEHIVDMPLAVCADVACVEFRKDDVDCNGEAAKSGLKKSETSELFMVKCNRGALELSPNH